MEKTQMTKIFSKNNLSIEKDLKLNSTFHFDSALTCPLFKNKAKNDDSITIKYKQVKKE